MRNATASDRFILLEHCIEILPTADYHRKRAIRLTHNMPKNKKELRRFLSLAIIGQLLTT